jgi:hypothetical protein
VQRELMRHANIPTTMNVQWGPMTHGKRQVHGNGGDDIEFCRSCREPARGRKPTSYHYRGLKWPWETRQKVCNK